MGKAKKFPQIPADRVRMIRKELGMNQEAFGNLFGVTDKYISNIETRDKALSLRLAKKISEKSKYPVRVDWLMGLSEQRTENDLMSLKMEGKEASFRSVWIILADALQEKGQTLAFHPNSQFQSDELPLYALPSLGEFVIENRASHAPVFKLPAGKMQELQRKLTRYAGFLLEEMIEEGETDNGEH